MRGVSSGVARVLVGIVLVSSVIGGSIVVAADGNGGNGATVSKNASYDLDELRRGGKSVSGTAPSYRWLGEDASVWVDRAHTNPLKDGGDEKWRAEQLVTPGETVNTNKIRLHYQGARSTDNSTYDLHIVFWERGTRNKTTPNGTVQVPAAVNQTHVERDVTFPSAFSVTEVPLRPHYDRTVRVTMWIEDVDGARWTFKHHSLDTARTVTTQTAGERTWWLIKTFGVWILLFGIIATAATQWAVKRAGAGPQLGLLTWAFVIGLGGFVALIVNYEGIATLFVRAPKVLAAVTVALLTVMWLEGQDDRLRKILFVRPVVTDAVSASGAEAKDALYLEMSEKKVAELTDGTLSVVTAGPIKFIARVLGGAAPLMGARDMSKTEVRADGDTSHDRVVWITPESEEILDYAPETIDLERPPDLSLGIGATGIVLLVGNSAWIGGVPIVQYLAYAMLGFGALTALKVKSGHAKIEPANVHQRSAHVTAMQLSQEVADAETLDKARKETYKERAKSSKDVEDVVELRDDTLVSEMLGIDVSASVNGDDETEPEIPESDVARPDRDGEVPVDD
jgi:hypothetical protein